MRNNISKYLLVVLSVGMCQQGFAWMINVQNKTKGQVRVDVTLAATNEQRNQIVEAGANATIDTAGWCTSWVATVGTSGTLMNKSTAWQQPPATGFGISCRSFKLNIEETASNNIVQNME